MDGRNRVGYRINRFGCEKKMNNNLGFAFIPGTFPTGTVLYKIREGLPTQKDNWSRKKINDLYHLYKTGIESGIPIYKAGQTKILTYMRDNSNYTDAETRVFAWMLYTLVKKGIINKKYWDIKLQSQTGIKATVNKALSDILPTADIEKITKSIKVVGVISLVGVGLYFAWPILKKIKKRIQ